MKNVDGLLTLYKICKARIEEQWEGDYTLDMFRSNLESVKARKGDGHSTIQWANYIIKDFSQHLAFEKFREK